MKNRHSSQASIPTTAARKRNALGPLTSRTSRSTVDATTQASKLMHKRRNVSARHAPDKIGADRNADEHAGQDLRDQRYRGAGDQARRQVSNRRERRLRQPDEPQGRSEFTLGDVHRHSSPRFRPDISVSLHKTRYMGWFFRPPYFHDALKTPMFRLTRARIVLLIGFSVFPLLPAMVFISSPG